MQMKNFEFDYIFECMIKCFRALGVKEQTIWCAYYKALCSIRKFHHERGYQLYDEKILAEYERSIETRYHNKDIGRKCHRDMMRFAEQMREYTTTGEIQWTKHPQHSHTVLRSENETILQKFLDSINVVSITRGDISWSVRKYLSFMETRGLLFKDITANDVRHFYAFCDGSLSKSSMRNVQCYIRKFHCYIEQLGYPKMSDSFVLMTSFKRHRRILPSLTWDEFNQILSQINIHTGQGRRDYAMFLLAASTALRGVDIVNMKLTDIDWANGIINVLQHKTNQYQSVPLTKAAGEAIQAYILNGRPDCGSEYLFLSVRPPVKKLKDSMSLCYLIRHYQKKAGMKIEAYDGKAFHSIRRMVGTNMVTSGVSVPLAAQTLGHRALQDIHKYISLDSSHLKECAISFKGIELSDGWWNL